MELVLRRLKSLDRGRGGNPTASNRLDYGQCFQSVRGVAQALMGTMKPLALLLGELFWLATYLHVAPSELPIV